MLLFHPLTIVQVFGIVGFSFCLLVCLQKMQNDCEDLVQ